MWKNKSFLVFLFTYISFGLASQNHISNGGFENYTSCPSSGGQLSHATDWINPNTETPDFFHTCAGTSCVNAPYICVPNNWAGNQNPHSGQGYAGIFVLGSPSREYLQVPLTAPLLPGIKYEVSCYISLADNYDRAIDEIGFYFSSTPVSGVQQLNFTPQITTPTNQFYTNKSGWTHFSDTLVATGNEQYLTIGNFKDEATTNYTTGQGGINYSYYYIDNVQVRIPELTITGDSLICQGDSVILTAANAIGPISWALSSSPGNIISNSSSIVVNPPTSTTYLLYDSRDTASITVTATSPPSKSLGKDTTLCTGQTLLLDASLPNATYAWHDNSSLPAFSVTQAGTYWVEITVGGCTISDTINVDYFTAPTLNLGNDTTVCRGDLVQLNANIPGAAYSWQDGSSNAAYTVSTPGVYWVKATVNGCVQFDSVRVNHDQATAVNLGEDTTLCNGESLTLQAPSNASYHWQNGSTSQTLKVSQPGLYWVEVSSAHCVVSDSINVNFTLVPKVNLGSDTTLCSGDILQLDASVAGATYQWQDGSTDPDFTVQQEGKYYVTVNLNGCVRSDTVEITYNPLPPINLGRDTVLCEGEDLVLKVNVPGASVTWQNGSSKSSYTVKEEGLYWVEASNTHCTEVDSIQVSYHSLPQLGLGADTAFCPGDTILLDVSTPTANSYLWNDSSTSSEYTILQAGTYSVEVRNEFCSISDSIEVKMKREVCDCELFIPNAFTPNNDGVNEEFWMSANCPLSTFQFSVFNRWGEKLFETNNLNARWNGSDLKEVPSGTYPYVIIYKFENESAQKKKIGSISLIR